MARRYTRKTTQTVSMYQIRGAPCLMVRSMSPRSLAVPVQLVLLLALLLPGAAAPSGAAQRQTPTPVSATPDLQGALPWEIPDDAQRMIVEEVLDGDTVRLTYPGDDWYYPVRLIGIQAPEMDGPYTRRECYGPEATDFLTELLPPGTEVFVQRDITDEDRNGRYLRHIFVTGPNLPKSTRTASKSDDRTDVFLLSEVLVLGGFAQARSYPPDDLYDDVLAEAEEIARDDRSGLWGRCAA